MPLLTRRLALLAKVETTPGTDSVPTGAANSIQVRSLTLTPINLETADRSLIRPYLGGSDQIPVGEYAQLEFEVDLAGAGTSVTTAPKWSPLVRGCGFAGAANGSTSYDHTPVSASFTTLTFYVYVGDTVLHKITGAMGTMTIDVTAGTIPSLRFRFIGYYNAPSDAASSGVAYTGWQTPVGTRDSNIPTMTLHSIAKATIPYRSLSIDIGNNLVYRNLIGSTSMMITDRTVVGSVELQYETVATKDWLSTIRGTTKAALAVQIGTTALNIVTLAAPQVQLINPRMSDVDGVQHLTMDMRLLPSSGNDELTIATL